MRITKFINLASISLKTTLYFRQNIPCSQPMPCYTENKINYALLIFVFFSLRSLDELVSNKHILYFPFDTFLSNHTLANIRASELGCISCEHLVNTSQESQVFFLQKAVTLYLHGPCIIKILCHVLHMTPLLKIKLLQSIFRSPNKTFWYYLL